ncbi:MAG: hypothetical protein HY455_03545 [Parcubacteria group bacterium]|nr:hypothetical protein [Parcubacteria group bacterium]
MAKPERTSPNKMPLRQPPKRELKMRQIVRQLQITPIPQIACERTGVSRATYYRWRTNDVVFSRAADHALEAGRFFVNDVIESQLIRKAKNGDGASQRYWLSHNHPKYSKKQIHEHCHICEVKSTEERHRDSRRDRRGYEVVYGGILKNIGADEVDERMEKDAHKIEDWMFERFEMLGEDTSIENDGNDPSNKSGHQNSNAPTPPDHS